MKKILVSMMVMFASSLSMAGEPKAALCRNTALNAATGLFLINVKPVGDIAARADLYDMNHNSENGFEVWDVFFSETDGNNSDGKINFSPYRLTIAIDGCIVTNFEMPTAG